MTSFEAIVESHVRRRVTRNHLIEKAAKEKHKKNESQLVPPPITFSCAYGSGAKQIVGRISNALGFQVFDKELIEAISQSTRVQARIIEALDEGDRKRVLSLTEQIFTRDYIDDVLYFNALVRVVRSLALVGRSIFIGRGSCHILRDLNAFNVRIVGAFDDRVRKIMKKNKLNEKDSANEVQEQDLRKQGIIRRYFNRNIDDPEAYHLIINTSHIPASLAVDHIISLYRATTGVGESALGIGVAGM
ncbi:MAG: cytidylate kinase-like family protein [Planctomycetota bacterium]